MRDYIRRVDEGWRMAREAQAFDARRLHPAYLDETGPWHLVEIDTMTGVERLVMYRPEADALDPARYKRAFPDRAAADAEAAHRAAIIVPRYTYDTRPGDPPAGLTP